MNILSTLKSEYSRSLILLVIPGSIALFPYSVMLYKYYDLHVDKLESYFIYIAFIYLFASLFIGFIIQDLGARLEEYYDSLYCQKNKKSESGYLRQFQKYLFNKRREDYIITHYYRSMLVRMKFELHTVCGILILWMGMTIRAFWVEKFAIDCSRTLAFITISLIVFVYLNIEAYKGIKTLHFYRNQINKKFKPSFDQTDLVIAEPVDNKNTSAPANSLI
jgi:hypothetical protein